MTPEEHRRRGDAAQALFRTVVGRATGNERRERAQDAAPAPLAALWHRTRCPRLPRCYSSR
jgi:hypothetical protein